MPKNTRLLVGTAKGLFIYETDENRREWKLSSPQLGGVEIYSVCGDARNNRILAGTCSYPDGVGIQVSTDGGGTWKPVRQSPRYAKESGFELKHIWQIVPGHPSQPGVWYAGVDEAGLFVSRDDGDTWEELDGLTRHPTRKDWVPGNGGLCLHTILVDPTNAKRLWVGISAVGVFRTEDGGRSWTVCNNGLRNVAPEFITAENMGRCVHKMALDPEKPGVLYMQFHGGVFRTDNGADSWESIANGLPSDFGFPMAVTRKRDVFIVPLLADSNRVVPEGKLRVYRSRGGTRTWKALSSGLPQDSHFVGVLRDAMAADAQDPAGIYFGTTMGELFASTDDGDTWQRLPGQLPRINFVHCFAR